VRLGVYTDLVFRRTDAGLATDRAYVRFVLGLTDRLDELVVFGRLAPDEDRLRGSEPQSPPAPYLICPRPRVRCVTLPHYETLADPLAVGRAVRGARAAFRRELDALDAVWIFGPHPLGLAFVASARRHGTPVALCVRQDLPAYVGSRIRGVKRPAALATAHALERSFRLLARRLPTVVVGPALEEAYSGGSAPVLPIRFSQVAEADLADPDDAVARPWEPPLRLLSVGRLDPEKHPLLLADALAALRRDGRDWRLQVVGTGPLRDALAARASGLGLGDALELVGYVEAGPALWERYRGSHAFLHVSRTEGFPSTILEAQAAGVPVVATAVGGVAGAVAGSALLVPSDDAEAAAAALRRLADEPELRERLVRAGLAQAATGTRERELDRLAVFLAAMR
jgi:glycosyltransferase involved in cell wall biosynthesis